MPRTTKRAVGSSGRGPRIEGHGRLKDAGSTRRRRLAEHEHKIADLQTALADTADADRPSTGSSGSGRRESS